MQSQDEKSPLYTVGQSIFFDEKPSRIQSLFQAIFCYFFEYLKFHWVDFPAVKPAVVDILCMCLTSHHLSLITLLLCLHFFFLQSFHCSAFLASIARRAWRAGRGFLRACESLLFFGGASPANVKFTSRMSSVRVRRQKRRFFIQLLSSESVSSVVVTLLRMALLSVFRLHENHSSLLRVPNWTCICINMNMYMYESFFRELSVSF